ncbi:MAG: hypothetical protein E7006_01935 [Alphaproteobacteria bacterium]|nr:hypothetical protein [Alphaproteobacteria bacterium]
MTDIDLQYARCFSTPAGMAVLQHLRDTILNRTLGCNATDFQLRWHESQRALVQQIETHITRGRGDK